MNELEPTPTPVSRAEIEQVNKRLSTAEVMVKAVQEELERIRSAVSLSISEALDTAEKRAIAAIEPVKQDCAESKRILQIQEIRESERIRAEKAAAAKMAAEDARVQFLLDMAKDASDITGKHAAISHEHEEQEHKKAVDWTNAALLGFTALSGAGLFGLLKHLIGF